MTMFYCTCMINIQFRVFLAVIIFFNLCLYINVLTSMPSQILQALEIVRQGADRMPKNQLNQVLNAELGSDWSSKLTSFDYEPMASASIGQVMNLSLFILCYIFDSAC